MKVLIVDCYDSFTFNLYQQVGKLGAEPVVLPCDTPINIVKRTPCDRIILSPGREPRRMPVSVLMYWRR